LAAYVSVNHADIKNIESIAVDPKDPTRVCRHLALAWKTSDGGGQLAAD